MDKVVLKNFLLKLQQSKVQVRLEGNELKIKAPKGVLNGGIIEELNEHKENLIIYLKGKKIDKIIIPRIDETKSRYSISNSQQRLWILSQFEEGSIAYNIPVILELEGDLNKEAFKASFNLLLERHESLRTVFTEPVKGDVYQVIKSISQLGFEVKELDTSDNKLSVLIKEELAQSFDLTNGPLLRASLFQTNSNKYVLTFVMHHIISDGWSIGVLIRDLLTIYNAKVNNEPIPLDPLRIHYKDYAAWQHQQLQGAELEIHKKYWLEQFDGELPVLSLPTEYTRPAVKTYNGSTIIGSINKDLSKKLNTLTKEKGATLFMGLLSLVNTLIYRYTGQEDIVLGSPIAGRDHIELENQIGFYVNTLALRTLFEGSNSFNQLLENVKEVTLGAYEHQVYPFDELVDELKLSRDMSRNPLFDVMVVLQNNDTSTGGQTLGDVKVTTYKEEEHVISKFDMTYSFIELESEELNYSIEYNTDIYDERLMTQMSNHLVQLLEVIVENPGQSIGGLDYLNKVEKHQLLFEFNDKAIDYPKEKTIVELFEEQVENTPDNIAVVSQGLELTYKELNQKSNQLAYYLRSTYGIEPDDLIGVKLDRSEQMIIAILGILKSGGAYVPIDPEYPEERVKYMEKDSQCKVVLESKELSKFLNSVENYDTSSLKLQISPNSLCYIIYTSGTTGTPKGVMVEHQNVVSLLFPEENLFDFDSEDVWTLFHSYCFDFSVWEIFGCLLHGGKLVVVSKEVSRDPLSYKELLVKEGVTILNQTPSAFYGLSEVFKESNVMHSIRYVIFGGEALSPAKLSWWNSTYPTTKLVNMYGITETTVHVTYKEIGEEEINSGESNIGKALPTLSSYILGSELELLPQGITGELYIGGHGVTRGYLNSLDLTEDRFIPNPYVHGDRLYKTGDLARMLPNGELVYSGRKDNQVKVRGHRIELGEIESILQRKSELNDAVVVPKKNKNGETFLVAYVCSKQKHTVDDLTNYLRGKLPIYMIPSYFVQLDALPLTANGKVDKKSLPDPEGLEMSTGVEYLAPRNETEEKLVEIWESVLEKEKIGIKENFFLKGGDSIKVIRLLSKINNEFNIYLKVPYLYKNDTIELISADILTGTSDESLAKKELVDQFDKLREEVLSKSSNSSNIEDAYPMSDIERGMIYASELDQETGVYHDQMIYPFKYENFDHNLFKQAIHLLVNKHEILRTVFSFDSYSSDVQIVLKETEETLTHIDLTEEGDINTTDFITTYITKARQNTFDVSTSLWRFTLFSVSESEKALLLECHHAILDGWSVASLVTELNNIYQKLQGNKTYVPVKLKSSYKDMVFSEIIEKRNERAGKYWEAELLGYERLDLFTSSSTHDAITNNIDEELYSKLKLLSTSSNISLKTLTFSAYLYLLNTLTYEEDITTGLVGETRPVIEDGDKVLGCFVNTTPFRYDFSKDDLTWQEYIQFINSKLLEQRLTGRLTLVEINHILGEYQPGLNPFFDTYFNYVDFHIYNDLDTENHQKSKTEQGEKINPFERTNTFFNFSISNTGESGMSVNVLLTRKLKSGINSDKLYNFYCSILEAMVNMPKAKITTDILLSNKEKHQLLVEFNDTEVNYPKDKTIIQLFGEQVEKTPDNIAVVFENVELTYRELNEKSNQLGHYLQSTYSIKPDDLIGIKLNRSEQMIIAILGVLKSGGAYVPIDPEYPEDRINYIKEDSNCKVVVDEKELSILLNEQPITKPDISTKSTDLAYVIYTSGSTGKPKGCMLEHSGVVNRIEWMWKAYNFSKDDVILQKTTFTFDVSVWEILMPLCWGCKMILCSKDEIKSPESILRLVSNHGITTMHFVPSMFSAFIEEALGDTIVDSFNSLKRIITSGEALPLGLVQRWYAQTSIPIYNLYGPTEASIDVTHYTTSEHDNLIPIGRPIANTEIYVLDNTNSILPLSSVGEILIGGIGLARGYLNRPELTEEKFIAHPFKEGERLYKTGDLGRWLPDGNIEFIGRKDDQVKIRGYRIELGEIESCLHQLEEVDSCVVLAKEFGDNTGNELVGYIKGNDLSISSLRNELGKVLPDYMIPNHFVALEDFPLTPNGKVDKKALPNPEGLNMSTGVEYLAPRNEIEKQLVSIWSEVLGIELEKTGINDNFFELGGHSLKAVKLLSLIHKHFEVKQKLKDFFSSPIISSQSDFISTSTKVNFINIKELETKPYYPVSGSQQRLWALSQFEEGSFAYNMSGVYTLDGDLNQTAFISSFDFLVERHETLRTVFVESEEGEVRQEIKPFNELGFKVSVSDYQNQSEEALQKELKAKLREGFELEKGPLLKASLYRTASDKYIFAFVMHHIISDGWSMGVLIKDLFTFYNAKVNNQLVPLDPLRIHYKDFAAWQLDQLQGEELKKHRDYWLNQFSGELPALDLPSDYNRPAVKTYNGSVKSGRVNKDLSSKLNILSKAKGGTLFMGLLSLVNTLFQRYTGQEDITIGSVIAGRDHVDLENQIGFYLNTLALRTRFERSNSFNDLLSNVKEVTLGAYDHQIYPFDELVEELNLSKDRSRNPMFDVMVLLQNHDISAGGQTLGDVKVTHYEAVEHIVSKFDMTFFFTEFDNGEIEYIIEYNTDIYSEGFVKLMSNHLIQILEQVTLDSDQPLNLLNKQIDFNIHEYINNKEFEHTPVSMDVQPFTKHQERLWFIDLFEKGSVYTNAPIYHNIPLLIELVETVDIKRLKKSLTNVLKTIPSLLVNDSSQNELQLKINIPENFKLWDDVECDSPINYIKKIKEQPFNLQLDNLIKAGIVQNSEGEIFIGLTIHHLIFDPSSIQILLNELFKRYEGIESPGTKYLDINLKKDYKKSALTYWKRKGVDKSIKLNLPLKRRREPIHVYESSEQNLTFKIRNISKIKDWLSSNEVSFDVFVLGIFKLVLHRFSSQSELVVGTFTNVKRDLLKTKQFGALDNLVPIVSKFVSSLSLEDFLLELQKNVNEAQRYGCIQYEDLCNELKLDKDMSRVALFDVLYRYSECNDNELLRMVLNSNAGFGKYDVSLFAQLIDESSLNLNINYNSLYFDRGLIEDILKGIENILSDINLGEKQELAEFNVIPQADVQKLINNVDSRSDAKDLERSIIDLFSDSVRSYPINTALKYNGESYSYSELDEESTLFMSFLSSEYNIKKGEFVGIKMTKSERLIIVMLGVLKSGASYVPIDPNLPQSRVNFITHNSNCTVTVDNEIYEKYRKSKQTINKLNVIPSINSNDIAYLMYTSGSTGDPKGVLVKHLNVTRLVSPLNSVIEVSSDDVWSMSHSYGFDFTVWEIFGALSTGGTLLILDDATVKDPFEFTNSILSEKVSVFSQTPSSFFNIEKFLSTDENHLRHIIFGGEKLEPSNLDKWHDKFPNINYINMFGITEASVHTTFKRLSRHEIDNNLSIIGSALPGCSCYVLDKNMKIAPRNVIGELYIGGYGVAEGYYREEKLTKSRFVKHPDFNIGTLYKTGDHVRLTSQGELEYIGREDSQVKIRGHRVELGEVESGLQQLEQIELYAVLAKELNGDSITELVAYVKGENLIISKLREELSKILPSYMIPSHFVELEEFPLTSNGKVNKEALPDPEGLGMSTGIKYVAPRNEIEKKLVDIWSEVLVIEADKIGVNDDFFDLGGHSLKGIKLMNFVKKQFNVKLKLEDMFISAKLEEMALFIEANSIEETLETEEAEEEFLI